MKKTTEKNAATKKTLLSKFAKIKQFLRDNAESIEDRSTHLHKIYLSSNGLRDEFLEQFKGQHLRIIQEIARRIDVKDIKSATEEMRVFGKKIAEAALRQGLTIEESVNGSIFLKQAIWEHLETAGLVKTLSAEEMYEISQKLGNYIDVIGSQIAFTFHGYFKKAEEQQYKLAAIVNSSEDAIVSKTLDSIITSWNKSAEKLFGYKAREAIGEPITIIIPKELLHEEEHIITNIKQGKPIEHFETVRLRKDGSRVPVSLSISPVKDTKGNIIGASKIARDITEVKQAEENTKFLSDASKILSSSLKLQEIFNGVTKLAVPQIADWCAVDMLNDHEVFEIVAIAHKETKKVKLVKEYRKQNPINMDDTFGLPQVVKTKKSEFIPEITDAMLKAIAKDEHEYKLIKDLGMSSVMSVPLVIRGEAIGAITFVSSESRKRLTVADLRMAEELATRAALAIENARLFDEAQKAIAIRDEFISVASHELKTPVTSLKMYTQVMQSQLERQGNDSYTRPLSKMNEQINKLTNLIGDLLNVSKVQVGKLEFREEAFDINEVVTDVIENIQPTATKHTIVREGTIKNSVWGDKDRIGQVITNLITNAIKYSPKANKVVVRVTPEKDNAVITVQDFGIGIDKEHQRRIFERFYRVNNAEEITFPGLGLGLYISYQIVKRHGGEMSVVSSKGKGSQFSFTLPYENKKTEHAVRKVKPTQSNSVKSSNMF